MREKHARKTAGSFEPERRPCPARAFSNLREISIILYRLVHDTVYIGMLARHLLKSLGAGGIYNEPPKSIFMS
jgi:hypothetical protein